MNNSFLICSVQKVQILQSVSYLRHTHKDSKTQTQGQSKRSGRGERSIMGSLHWEFYLYVSWIHSNRKVS